MTFAVLTEPGCRLWTTQMILSRAMMSLCLIANIGRESDHTTYQRWASVNQHITSLACSIHVEDLRRRNLVDGQSVLADIEAVARHFL
jgi:hypothetical protein